MSHCGMLGRSVRIRAAIMIALEVWLIFVARASAKVTRVPQDALSISGAVRNANDGDEIIVSPGLYKETNITCGNRKTLNIHSTDPTNWDIVNSTIIEGGGATSNLPVLNLGNYSIHIAGFTIRNGGASGVIGGDEGSVIEYCHIMDNWGGRRIMTDGLSQGGGLNGCQGTIQNCIIERNYAELGGGLMGCSGTIQNNFIVRNRLVDWGNRGAAGAAIGNCTALIRGNTIVDNGIGGQGPGGNGYVWRGGGLSQCEGIISDNIIWVSEPNFQPEYDRCSKPTFCCIKGWTGGGKGNINSDPMLFNAQFDKTPGADHPWPSQDWRLRPDSPCIDEGTTAGLTTDFYGKARGVAWRSNRVHGDNTHTDMGAHEFVPGKLTLWVQRFHEPLFAGGQLRVKWAMQSGAGSAFALRLFKGSAKIADFGQFAAGTGHVDFDTAGGFWVTLPAKMVTATDYTLVGQITGSSPTYPSPPFWVMSTSGVQRESWAMYR